MSQNRTTNILVRVVCAVGIILILGFIYQVAVPAHRKPWALIPETTVHRDNSSDATEDATTTISCRDLPGAKNVFIIMKTGSSEIYQKLPIHFMTTLQCASSHMIFSDLQQDFGGEKVIDALEGVTSKSKEEYEEFVLYDRIQRWAYEGQDLTQLPSGWALDKYKFMPMLHKVFEEAPDHIDWFFMMEPDTSLSWLNLLLWLKTMDPKKSLYLGSETTLGETTFAHGGSGVLISRGAAEKLKAARHKDPEGVAAYDERWERETSEVCCGDAIVAMAFREVGVDLTWSSPTIQGETLRTVDWSESHWCSPAVTWHHVDGDLVDIMWQYEQDWVGQHGWDTPYFFRDVFEHFVEPRIAVNRTYWNNKSGSRIIEFEKSDSTQAEKDATSSFDACAAACVQVGAEECMQWMWKPGHCQFGDVIVYGTTDEEEIDHWESGWMLDRVQKFKKPWEGCKPQWRGFNL